MVLTFIIKNCIVLERKDRKEDNLAISKTDKLNH